MKKMILSAKAALGAALGRFFYTRPALKRALLVFALWLPSALLDVLLGDAYAAPVWSWVLIALFWGMGAERAALDWDPVFSLPPVKSLAFWRWHPLELKRFRGAFTTLLLCGGAFLVWGAFK